MINDLKKFLNEEQDPKAVEKLLVKVNGLLTSGEEVEYIAVQKKPAINLSPDCIALTNKRIIFCRPRNLGLSMDFQDYAWKDILDCHMKEGIMGATFSMKTIKGHVNMLDYLPKAQARKLYQFAQQKEEEMVVFRREHDLENKRAIAGGGITVNANIPTQQNVEQKEDPLETLQKLKKLLESEIISQIEFDSKKTEILSKM
ncbi:PH (Pleckstrin Homology) domain-containing protein [Flavobacterium sp. 90]|uniref:PH domain-containing protein n=1 Tax=unclassified Flavobacterium TaxID=196869 RepID=UPI000EAE9FA4|nr:MULTISPECIES: PH domain-containing protein [unclassified Flavobacterium]RKR11535.1 PH (Pleckstrin Homology) domain-containing protein [Flavobacterium sp. 81]TCK55316.1 PH (Pleckstrin Homology) domain-containing protein [Flavobacterium sp. 90]